MNDPPKQGQSLGSRCKLSVNETGRWGCMFGSGFARRTNRACLMAGCRAGMSQRRSFRMNENKYKFRQMFSCTPAKALFLWSDYGGCAVD